MSIAVWLLQMLTMWHGLVIKIPFYMDVLINYSCPNFNSYLVYLCESLRPWKVCNDLLFAQWNWYCDFDFHITIFPANSLKIKGSFLLISNSHFHWEKLIFCDFCSITHLIIICFIKMIFLFKNVAYRYCSELIYFSLIYFHYQYDLS